MKRLSEYTNEELINLTKEEYDNLVDSECMSEGAPLSIEVPIYKEIPSVPEPEVVLYEVSGFSFEDESEAKEFLKVVNSLKSCVRTDYDFYIRDSSYSYVAERNVRQNNRIVEKKVYTEETYDSVKSTLETINAIKEYNNDVKVEYKSKCKQRAAIIADVNVAISNAKDEFIRLEKALQLYKRYLALSEGNETIAQSFFSATEYADLFPKVLEKINAGQEEVNNE